MDKKELLFGDFLSDISPEFETYVAQLHNEMTKHGCGVKLKEAKNGLVVSFCDLKTDKVVANFVSRKKGPVIRIYCDHVSSYPEVISALPEAMLGAIEKTSVCRRLLDPTKCNARCPMGYVLTIGGTEHKKCRYNCFMFPINAANTPAITTLLEQEIKQRAV